MIKYVRKEKVMTIALLLALVSAFLVFPDKKYLTYIDYRVLSLLLCLMVVVKGFQTIGLFDVLIYKMCVRLGTVRRLVLAMVFLCFFLSMLITNDVSLITFVPFSIMALKLCNRQKDTIRVVVLQTLAANLGSMFTPIGNPQNLFLFSTSGMSLGQFFSTMFPYTAVSFVFLAIGCLFVKNEPISISLSHQDTVIDKKMLLFFCCLFVMNLLVVFHIVIWQVALLITIAVIFMTGKKELFYQADYALLLTFVGFFLFVGNVGRIPFVSQSVHSFISGNEVMASVLFSQVLSNVPAAILLSGFTKHFAGLLIGTNIGGLGTLIASMASLISYKIYAESEHAKRGRYFAVFTLWNVAGLILLLLFYFICMN